MLQLQFLFFVALACLWIAEDAPCLQLVANKFSGPLLLHELLGVLCRNFPSDSALLAHRSQAFRSRVNHWARLRRNSSQSRKVEWSLLQRGAWRYHWNRHWGFLLDEQFLGLHFCALLLLLLFCGPCDSGAFNLRLFVLLLVDRSRSGRRERRDPRS